MLLQTTFPSSYVAFILSFDGKIYGFYHKMFVPLQSKLQTQRRKDTEETKNLATLRLCDRKEITNRNKKNLCYITKSEKPE